MTSGDPVPSRHSWVSRRLFPLFRVLLWLLYASFAAPSVWFGSRRVPRRGALLVLVNHQSNCDPPFVQLVTPRPVHFMARRQLWEMPGVAAVVKWWRAFPVTQSSADRGALKNAVALLREGRCVAMFPEGKLSPDGKLLPLFAGAAMVARRSRAPVVCLGIRNTRRVMPDPEVVPRWAWCWLQARWGDVRTFDEHATDEEVMGWVQAELQSLSSQ